ncbi:hypothetical protein [Polymorphospora rubra]|nr:hypothetical protein [Polymorphospora rubra]
MTDEREVLVVRGQEQMRCRLRWTLLPDRTYRLVLGGPTGVVDVIGRDLFAALQDIRRMLEHGGWVIAVQGARVDSHPSGMVRDMLGARRVYILQKGRHVAREHLVDIFAEAEVSQIGTVDEQVEFYRLWRNSRAATPSPD